MKKECFCIFLICLIGVSGFCMEDDSMEELMSLIETCEAYLEKKPDDSDVLLKLGMCYHDISSEYDKNFGKEAVKYLKKAYELNPVAETKSWIGSAFMLIARYAEEMEDKISAVQQGIIYIDGAIEEDPESIIARLIRIENSMYLPEALQRLDVIEKDFTFLFAKIEKKPEVFKDVFDPGIVFLYKVQYLLAANELSLAHQYAQKGLKITQDEEIKDELSELIGDLGVESS